MAAMALNWGIVMGWRSETRFSFQQGKKQTSKQATAP